MMKKTGSASPPAAAASSAAPAQKAPPVMPNIMDMLPVWRPELEKPEHAKILRHFTKQQVKNYRRCPIDPKTNRLTYWAVNCPDGKNCKRGTLCPYTHNVVEYLYHPATFKTIPCSKDPCTHPDCAMYHEGRNDSRRAIAGRYALRQPALPFDVDTYLTFPCTCGAPSRNHTCLGYHDLSHRRRPSSQYSHEFCDKLFDPIGRRLEGGSCPDGDACRFAHTIPESLFHPDAYKCKLCKHLDRCVNQVTCPFAHKEEELRMPVLPMSLMGTNAKFTLKFFKVFPCIYAEQHDFKQCIYYHNLLDMRRPLSVGYSASICTRLTTTRHCPDGYRCKYAHNVAEEKYHCETYKTDICANMDRSGKCHRDKFCAFAHGMHERRRPTDWATEFPGEEPGAMPVYVPSEWMDTPKPPTPTATAAAAAHPPSSSPASASSSSASVGRTTPEATHDESDEGEESESDHEAAPQQQQQAPSRPKSEASSRPLAEVSSRPLAEVSSRPLAAEVSSSSSSSSRPLAAEMSSSSRPLAREIESEPPAVPAPVAVQAVPISSPASVAAPASIAVAGVPVVVPVMPVSSVPLSSVPVTASSSSSPRIEQARAQQPATVVVTAPASAPAAAAAVPGAAVPMSPSLQTPSPSQPAQEDLGVFQRGRVLTLLASEQSADVVLRDLLTYSAFERCIVLSNDRESKERCLQVGSAIADCQLVDLWGSTTAPTALSARPQILLMEASSAQLIQKVLATKDFKIKCLLVGMFCDAPVGYPFYGCVSIKVDHIDKVARAASRSVVECPSLVSYLPSFFPESVDLPKARKSLIDFEEAMFAVDRNCRKCTDSGSFVLRVHVLAHPPHQAAQGQEAVIPAKVDDKMRVIPSRKLVEGRKIEVYEGTVKQDTGSDERCGIMRLPPDTEKLKQRQVAIALLLRKEENILQHAGYANDGFFAEEYTWCSLRDMINGFASDIQPSDFDPHPTLRIIRVRRPIARIPCPICRDPFSSTNGAFLVDSVRKKIVCRHIYHTECLEAALQQDSQYDCFCRGVWNEYSIPVPVTADDVCHVCALLGIKGVAVARCLGCPGYTYCTDHLAQHQQVSGHQMTPIPPKTNAGLVLNNGVVGLSIIQGLLRGIAAIHSTEMADFSLLPPAKPDWLAPEVQAGEPASKASDVYSMGLVIFYMITKISPETLRQVHRDIRESQFFQNLQLLLPDAYDLLWQMLRQVAAERPTAEQCIAHPFFWSGSLRTLFISTVYERIKMAPQGQLARAMKMPGILQHMMQVADWRELLPAPLLAPLREWRSSLGKPDYAADLLGLLHAVRDMRKLVVNNHPVYRGAVTDSVVAQVVGMSFPLFVYRLFQMVKHYPAEGCFFRNHPDFECVSKCFSSNCFMVVAAGTK
eukprot:m51a1_g7164 hypothetical protein (1379) ;mRNA; r:46832-51943